MTQLLPHEKTYVATRTRGGCSVAVIRTDHSSYMLEPRLGLITHRVPFFDWGVEDRPAGQLALAILVDHFADTMPRIYADSKALKLYLQFARRVLTQRRHDSWQLTSLDVEDELKQLELLEGGEYVA